MNELSKKVLEFYQVRKTRKQKLSFIEFIKENVPNARVEEGGLIKCRNIVIGDPDKAKAVFTAHYDTCAMLPFPNLIFPRNIFFSVLYSVLIVLPFVAVIPLCQLTLFRGIDSFLLRYWISLFIFIGLFLFVFIFGIPNRHTANDNTSGVISVLELYARLSPEERDKCAFVLFDHEETGLFGSGFFKKKHPETAKNTLLINLDCVGDGDNLLLVMPKAAKGYEDLLRDSFNHTGENKLNLLICDAGTTFYPSDQARFPKGVGVAALHRKKFWGYYMGRIHTAWDTVCEEKNISFVTEGLLSFVAKL